MKIIKSLLPFHKRRLKYYPVRMSWFNDMWREEPATIPRQASFFPEIDLYDNGAEYKLKADLPGWQKKDLNLTVDENAVILRGKHQEDSGGKEGEYLRQERRLFSFERKISLSETVSPERLRRT